MDSNPGSPAPLQFDTAVPRVTPSDVGTSAQGVTCVACQRAIVDEYFDVNGQSICESCRDEIAQHAVTPRGMGVFGIACLFGLGAAILGAILYYAVIAITNFEIGLVAIAIGYMVGYAVRKATGGRGGRRFQVLALVLTYWAVGLAYTPLAFQQMTDESTQGAQSPSTAQAPAAESAAAGEPTADEEPILALVIVTLLGISLALPVLSVISSLPSGLISAAIIAFGMLQAWRMTGVPALQMSGPYRIAAAPPTPL